MSPLIARRVGLALAVIGALVAAIGACGGDFAFAPGDGGGGGFDLGNATSDLGAASDGAAQSIQVTLATPAPFQSMVATTTNFEFLATLPGGSTAQYLEPYVQIVPRPSGSALGGAFNWQSTGPSAYQLNFLPAALADNTDYVVTVANPLGGSPLLKTGVSIGSAPRVIHVVLSVKKSAAAVSFLVSFSEPMNPTSVTGNLVLTANGVAVPATVAEVAGETTHLHFQLDVTSPHNLAMPLVLTAGGATMAISQVPLIAASWDSPTDDGKGNFYWQPTLPSSLDALTADTTYEFVPKIN